MNYVMQHYALAYMYHFHMYYIQLGLYSDDQWPLTNSLSKGYIWACSNAHAHVGFNGVFIFHDLAQLLYTQH